MRTKDWVAWTLRNCLIRDYEGVAERVQQLATFIQGLTPEEFGAEATVCPDCGAILPLVGTLVEAHELTHKGGKA